MQIRIGWGWHVFAHLVGIRLRLDCTVTNVQTKADKSVSGILANSGSMSIEIGWTNEWPKQGK